MGLELIQLSRLNESMKKIIGASYQVNMLALNAMFMIRHLKNEQGGFSRVTALFREFSDRLNSQTQKNFLASNLMIGKAAKFKIYIHRDDLIQKALDDSRAKYIKDSYVTGVGTSKVRQDLDNNRNILMTGIRKSIRLVEEAEVLSVLTKIEAKHSGVENKVTENLIKDLEDAISSINVNINTCMAAMSS